MNLIQISGFLAIAGAFFYAVGDVLLLAAKADPQEYPKLRPFSGLLSGAERMIVLTPRRMLVGALLGVFATPLVLAGFWQLYHGLAGANTSLALACVLLFAIGSVIGAFVHGSFYYLGEYVHALNNVDEASQAVIAGMMTRHRRVMIIGYAPILIFVISASVLFASLVAQGGTQFPRWMSVINPLTLTLAWLGIKRSLPQFVRDWTEGAGFNIAFFIFFLFTTITLWNGASA